MKRPHQYIFKENFVADTLSPFDYEENGASVIPDDKQGKVWKVAIIKAGSSKNLLDFPGNIKGRFFYSKEFLASQAKKFEGVKVFAHKAAPHVSPNTQSVHDEIGWLSDVSMNESTGELVAKLHLLPSAEWIRANLMEAYNKGKTDLYELSIHAGGKALPKLQPDGTYLIVAESFDQITSVDVVSSGAAGGRFIEMLESHKQNHNNNNHGVTTMNVKLKLMTLFTLFYPQYLESANVDWVKVDENELYTHLFNADKTQSRFQLPDSFSEANVDLALSKALQFKESGGDKPVAPNNDVIKAMIAKFEESFKETQKNVETMQRNTCAHTLDIQIRESQLPVPIQEMIRKSFMESDGKTVRIFAEAELTSTIAQHKETYGKLYPQNPHFAFAESGLDQRDKLQLAMDGFFLTSSISLNRLRPGTDDAKKHLKGIVPFKSIREAYVEVTGDVDVTGDVRKSRNFRMTEAIDTTAFANIVLDALNKRLIRDYEALNLDTWRNIADVIPLSDFKTQHRTRFGGYGNLPTVGQSAAYPALTSPTDEQVTYAAVKRGGVDTITRETILNDDIGAVQKLPLRMARAAAQTLHEFVFAFIDPAVNPTYDVDSTAIYHANHSNIGAVALDATGLSAARLRMKKQTQSGSGKRIGIKAKWLIVPSDLEDQAYKLITPAYAQHNNTPEFLQQIGIVPIVVDYWTDTNNWVLAADKGAVELIEIGFVNGQETPELFVSDLNNVGSWFTNDVITYKIRHEYGGDLMDYRGFDGSIVA